MDDRFQEFEVRPSAKRVPAGEQFIEHDAKGKMSLRESSCWPDACSGDIYAIVPRISPWRVAPLGDSAARAEPSDSRPSPSPSRTA
jgi:hypothetical protein